MPAINDSSYKSPLLFRNGHIQSIYPSLFRKLDASIYTRERIATPDDDFLDLDWSCKGNNKLAIISHGLEGSSQRAYVIGMARALNSAGWEVLAWNFRSCSGEPNRRFKIYHNGDTTDLSTVVRHALNKNNYKEVTLVGFSMGGNITLSYLGKCADELPAEVAKAITYSVPCHLASSSRELAKAKNKIYMVRFLRMLYKKVKQKEGQFPDRISTQGYNKIKNFYDFDNKYTAPIHGFRDAEDYWSKCSSIQFISHIKIPTLIVNAANDPFLPEECYPVKEAELNKLVTLETPKSGGHVGFISLNNKGRYWSEQRALDFLSDNR